MLYKGYVYLIRVEVDHSGPFAEETEVKRGTYANVKSVTRAEFSTADAQGVKAEYLFEVRDGEYQSEEWIEYEGKRYHIYRVYERGFVTELYGASGKGRN